MRVVASLAICVGTGMLSPALAVDPPVESASAPFTRDEQLLLARGFHVVEDNGRFKTDHGERIFCRREMSVGSRIISEQVCGTAKQINDMSRQSGAAASRKPGPAAWRPARGARPLRTPWALRSVVGKEPCGTDSGVVRPRDTR